MIITKNLGRLDLHDSIIEMEQRIDDDLILIFNWAKLENYMEGGIQESIVLGKTTLRIKGVTKEILKAYAENTKDWKMVELLPGDIGKYWQEVVTTEINDDDKTMQLEGMFLKGGRHDWVQWQLNFDRCSVEWNAFITLTDWQNGKSVLPH